MEGINGEGLGRGRELAEHFSRQGFEETSVTNHVPSGSSRTTPSQRVADHFKG
jgi:hypothetical protein